MRLINYDEFKTVEELEIVKKELHLGRQGEGIFSKIPNEILEFEIVDCSNAQKERMVCK